MDRSIILFTLLTFFSLRLFGEDKKQTLPAHREVVQVSTDNSYAKLFAHPTYAFFAGVPRARSLGGSVTLSPGNPAPSGPWKTGITATVFWVGEPPTANDPGNLVSAWDRNWLETAKTQNTFYVALPYNDVANGHTKPEASSIIPWFKEVFVRDGQSVLKDHWVAIRKGTRICYAQWEDVGPFKVDHWQYVFGNERPRPNKNRDAGIDVSPAVKEYLGMSGIDSCDWRFASGSEITQGPWKFREAAQRLTKVTPRRAVASLHQVRPM